MHHQNGNVTFGESLVKLFHPLVITLHDSVEFFIRHAFQKHFPAVHVRQTRYQSDVHPAHIHRIRIIAAHRLVFPLVGRDEFRLIEFAVKFRAIERERFVHVFEQY